MKTFKTFLDQFDLQHALRILETPAPDHEPAGHEQVRKFFHEQVFMDELTGGIFRRHARERRERVISELIWRITCHLDNSVTRVLGAKTYDLGYGFRASRGKVEGREALVVTAVGAKEGEGA